MNGKRAEINNTSKHVVLVSSPLSVLSSFSLHCYSIASPRFAWHCMPALRALRSLRALARSGMLTVLAPSWLFLAPSWDVLVQSWHVLALARLGAILGRPGAILGRLGRILASQKRPKTAPRGLQDASQDGVQHRPQLKTVQGPLLMEILDRNAQKKTCLVK